MNTLEETKCLIIGSGPAGYTAAIYAARANLKPILYAGLQPGGQLTTTTEVENFPGYPKGITGPEMMQDLQEQATRFGTQVRFDVVTKVDFSGSKHRVWINEEHEILADTVIISTGATAKYLGLPSEQKFLANGGGVSACATCDGFFYKGKNVIIVGAGDSACEEALYLSNICKKVTLLVRKEVMRASQVMQQRVLRKENIEVVFQASTLEILGDKVVTGAKVQVKDEVKTIEADGFFVAIGHTPNTEIFKAYLKTDEAGYFIKVNPASTETNIAGVFVAGDCADPVYRQAITAAGTGCMAALDAERYLTAIGAH